MTEVKRFHARARAVLAGTDDALTLREFLARGGFSDYFAAHFMTPLVAAVWSTAPRSDSLRPVPIPVTLVRMSDVTRLLDAAAAGEPHAAAELLPSEWLPRIQHDNAATFFRWPETAADRTAPAAAGTVL